MHLYLATDLQPAHPDERLGPDEDEHLRLEARPWDAAVEAALAGEIADAKSLVGLLWVDRQRSSVNRRRQPDRARTATRSRYTVDR
jgi:hypothetical protein